MSTTSQPSQPPKQSAYIQPSNPVTHNPSESKTTEQRSHQYGTAPATITRGASSTPSNNSSLNSTQKAKDESGKSLHAHSDVDTEYGVEQQPSEGDIAHAVEGHSRHRIQAGAHAGAVGSPQGPGAPARGEGVSNLQDLDRKAEEHQRILGERVGRSPEPPYDDGMGGGESAEREKVRERKLRQDRELHPKDVVQEATGEPVVGR
ncbi:hypothetical protein BDW74DRAFT_92177 [Aspergillus multicolor]|uniref:uncharacterized protein n=1 Tax=Aspergillus multicolor TaxID=41759 RepID=UPI003CCC989F